MAYATTVVLTQGNLRPIYAEAIAPNNGTITIQPGGTFTLYDSTGTVVAGFNGVPVSGYDSGALQVAQIWYILNTSGLNPTLLPSCSYAAIIKFNGIGSDGITRTFVCDIQIIISPPVQVAATYDPSKLVNNQLYQVRYWLADTNMQYPTFSDAEITYALDYSNGNVQLAGSSLLDALDVNSAQVANMVKIGSFGSGAVEVYKAIKERAANLRKIALVAPTVNSPCPQFVQDYSCTGGTTGTMNPW